MTEHPAVAHLLAAHEKATSLYGLFTAAVHPGIVKRRAAGDRRILAEHAGDWPAGEPDGEEPPTMCITCEAPGWPCRTVLALAAAWGWEDRPADTRPYPSANPGD